jgi:hypothetical protein
MPFSQDPKAYSLYIRSYKIQCIYIIYGKYNPVYVEESIPNNLLEQKI